MSYTAFSFEFWSSTLSVKDQIVSRFISYTNSLPVTLRDASFDGWETLTFLVKPSVIENIRIPDYCSLFKLGLSKTKTQFGMWSDTGALVAYLFLIDQYCEY